MAFSSRMFGHKSELLGLFLDYYVQSDFCLRHMCIAQCRYPCNYLPQLSAYISSPACQVPQVRPPLGLWGQCVFMLCRFRAHMMSFGLVKKACTFFSYPQRFEFNNSCPDTEPASLSHCAR